MAPLFYLLFICICTEALLRKEPLPFNDNANLCEGDVLEFICRPRPNNVSVSIVKFSAEELPPVQDLIAEDDGEWLPHANHTVINTQNVTTVTHRFSNQGPLSVSYRYGPLRSSDSGVYACLVTPLLPSDFRSQFRRMRLTVRSDCKVHNFASLEYALAHWRWHILMVICLSLSLLSICGTAIYCRKPIKQPVHRTILITHNKDDQLSEKTSSYTAPSMVSNSKSTLYPSSQSRDSQLSNLLCTSSQDPICRPIVSFKSVNETPPPIRRYQQSFSTLRHRIKSVGSVGKRPDGSVNADRLLSEVNRRFSALYKLPADGDHELAREHLTLHSCIGSGAFGVVFSASVRHLPNRTPVQDKFSVAVKTLRENFTESDVIDLIREIDVMKQLHKHPHVIELLAVCTEGGAPLLIMEYAPYGNLRSFLRTRKSKLLQSPMLVAHLISFGRQVADGMKYLASRSVVHRDLAARNVLVGEKHLLKIADFGLTRAVENYYRKHSDGRLPIKWLSPESLFDRIYSNKSDVWSFGVLLWEIFTLGLSPFAGFEPVEVPRLLRTGYRNPKPRLAGDRVYGMMQACWHSDPKERPCFNQLFDQLKQWEQDECHYRGLIEGRISPGRETVLTSVGDDMSALCTPLLSDYLEQPRESCGDTSEIGGIRQPGYHGVSTASTRYVDVGDTDAPS